MPSGAKPGERRGGRAKGTPNKATVERRRQERIVDIVAAEISSDPRVGKAVVAKILERTPPSKLAKDQMEEFLPVVKGVVAKLQEQVMGPGIALNFADPGWDRLKRWMELYADVGFRLAEYQSPKYRAIAVVAPNPDPGPAALPDALNDNENDAVAVARLYRKMITASR